MSVYLSILFLLFFIRAITKSSKLHNFTLERHMYTETQQASFSAGDVMIIWSELGIFCRWFRRRFLREKPSGRISDADDDEHDHDHHHGLCSTVLICVLPVVHATIYFVKLPKTWYRSKNALLLPAFHNVIGRRGKIIRNALLALMLHRVSFLQVYIFWKTKNK